MPRLSLCGFARADEARLKAMLDTPGLAAWSLADDASADAVLIDLDSMVGQMAWLRGIRPGLTSIGLTAAAKAGTDHSLSAPLETDALRALLEHLVPTQPPAPAQPPAAEVYRLERWPPIDRSFPKHFRIATVMLKAPGRVAAIAEAAGVSEIEVTAFLDGVLASGHARRD